MQQRIMDELAGSRDGLTEKELVKRFGRSPKLQKAIHNELQLLVASDLVERNSRHRYRVKGAVKSEKETVNGVFRFISRGNGMVRLDAQRELIVPQKFCGWALTGDEVEVRILPPRRGKRGELLDAEPAAEILRVIKRGVDQWVGRFYRKRRKNWVTVQVGGQETDFEVGSVPGDVQDNDWVVVGPPGLDEKGQPPLPCPFISKLGDDNTPNLDSLILIRKAGLKEKV